MAQGGDTDTNAAIVGGMIGSIKSTHSSVSALNLIIYSESMSFQIKLSAW